MAGNSVDVSGTLSSATSGTEVSVTKATITLDVNGNTLDVECHDGASWVRMGDGVSAGRYTADAVVVVDLPEGAGPKRVRVTCSTYASGTARYSIVGR